MGKVIAVANQKGGTGKTTTAVHLAYYFAVKKKSSTLLIDADSQNSSSQWLYNLETVISNQAINEKNKLFEEIPELAKKYEYIIVDGPAGSLEGENKAIMARADLVVIPIQPKVLDLSSTLRELDRKNHPMIRHYPKRYQRTTSQDQASLLVLDLISVEPELQTYPFLWA